jgi:hypothetical protein
VSIRHRRTIAAAAAAGLLAVCVPASAAPAPATAAPAAAPATTTDLAAAAAGWLAQQFVGTAGKAAADGDHFDFPGNSFYWSGLTASAIFALAATRSGGDKIRAAISFMERNVAADANLGNGPSPGPFDGSVATAALAAIVAGVAPTSFGGVDLIQTLKDDECTAVTAPTDPTDFTTPTCPAIGAGNNTFSSVTESLIMLVDARASSAPSAAAVTYFLSLQCSDGGFTINTSGAAPCISDADATSYAMAALAALGDHQDVLDSARDWLLSQRNPVGYWVEPPTVGPNVDSTGLAVAALNATGTDSSTSRAWLASQQVTTGPTVGANSTRGALEFDGLANTKATADGLLGLASGASLATLTDAGASPGTAVLALATPAVASASVPQGGRQTVTGLGFGAKERVSAVLHSAARAVGSVTATALGTAAVTFTVPAALAVGTHRVTLTGATSGLSSTATFTVSKAAAAVAPSPTPPTAAPVGTGGPGGTPILAATGLDAQQALDEALVGMALIAAGAGILYLGRRRRA